MNRSPAGMAPAAELPASGGTYALLMTCREPRLLDIGRHGSLQLAPGCYVYVGSAFGPGGLRARIAHHLRPALRPHWHLDYLRRAASVDGIWYSTADSRQEHLWARLLHRSRGARIPLPGFGASDCRCPSHLFCFSGAPSFEGFRRRLYRATPGVRLRQLHLPPRPSATNGSQHRF